MFPKRDFCSACPINHVTEGYVPALIPPEATTLYVGEAAGEHEIEQGLAFVGPAGGWLNSALRAAKIDRSKIAIVNCIGCKPPGNIFPGDVKWTATDRATAKQAVDYCRHHHLLPAIYARKWQRIVTLGDKALEAVTNRKGILVWRGSPLAARTEEMGELKVIPTLHPAYIARTAHLFPVMVRDLKRSLTLPPEEYNLYASSVTEHLGRPISFDFEWDYGNNITLCGISSRLFGCDVYGWNGDTIQGLRELFESSPRLIGHNIIGADISHIDNLGWKIDWNTIGLDDTMLMQHLVQPDYKHDLGFVASVWTNKVFWKGRGVEEEDEDGNLVDTKVQWKTWDSSGTIPRQFGGYGGCGSADEAFRLYNARDTDAAFQLAIPLRQKLEEYGLVEVYENVSIPAAFICREIGKYGIKLNHGNLGAIRAELEQELTTLDAELPEGLRSFEKQIFKNAEAPKGSWKPKTIICKGDKKHGRHEPCEYIFQSPTQRFECQCGKVLMSGKMRELKKIKVPIAKRVVPWNSTKQVIDYAKSIGAKGVVNRKSGNATADKNARKVWGRQHREFAIVDQLKKRVTLKNSFAKDALLKTDRMYFNLLVHGTSEGRLSSSGKRKGIDVQIQNQPKMVRKIFIPDQDDWCFVKGDWKSAENWITAWLAQDHTRLKRLAESGYSEHEDYMQRLFGQNEQKMLVGEDGVKVENPYYTTAKRINHGTNYGMGIRKLQELLAVDGCNYTEGQLKEFKYIWEEMNPGTARWQQEVIALTGRQSYLRNAFGRIRFFQSRDFATKALAFLPASTLADICLRCMIAMNLDLPRCAAAAGNLGLQVTYQLPRPWRIAAQIHDEILCQGPTERKDEIIYGMGRVMKQSWPELNGFALDVDFGWSSKSWGECAEND